jgi:Mg2+/Co2+ transporter CorB
METQLFYLFSLIIILFIASLFSALETATVAISEHRLLSLQSGHLWARYAYKLKSDLNKVLLFSLFANSLFNTIFTAISTIIVTALLYQLHSEYILPISTLIIAFFIIIFSEAIPKIIAAKAPIATLKLIAIPMYYLFLVCRPIVLFINQIVYQITKILKIAGNEQISKEELKAIIADKNSPFKNKHRSILLNSMELENIVVKEVLIPLRMVEAININASLDLIKRQLYTTHHTRIIVYQDTIDNIIGFLHVKDLLTVFENDLELTRQAIHDLIRPIAFIHDFISIIKQIHHAQKYKHRIFVIINEYGDILGIGCLEDMLEMVFGDFTTESPQQKYLVVKKEHNQLIVDGTMLIRELNELCNLNITVDSEALTINGLVLKTLYGLPNNGVCFRLNNLIFEVIHVGSYWVERVKITIL